MGELAKTKKCMKVLRGEIIKLAYEGRSDNDEKILEVSKELDAIICRYIQIERCKKNC